ncbi:MAG: hypothetical protein SP4CHLAM17_09680 [Chlamydiales bacterium]|nr:hypothetical protein [Chlamydiales bacterium]
MFFFHDGGRDAPALHLLKHRVVLGIESLHHNKNHPLGYYIHMYKPSVLKTLINISLLPPFFKSEYFLPTKNISLIL